MDVALTIRLFPSTSLNATVTAQQLPTEVEPIGLIDATRVVGLTQLDTDGTPRALMNDLTIITETVPRVLSTAAL